MSKCQLIISKANDLGKGTGDFVVKYYDHKYLVRALRKIYDNKCQYCNETIPNIPKKAVVEHIIPISGGGSRSTMNCTLSCQGCNASKRNKTLRATLSSIQHNAMRIAEELFSIYLEEKKNR